MQTRSKLNRAKLFLSYDALKGFKERIHEKERIVVNKPILSEDQLYELDWKIKQIKVGMMVSIVYYDNNQFVYKEGIVTGTDFEYKKEISFSSKTDTNKDYIVKSAYRFILGIFALLLVFLILNYIMPKYVLFKFLKYLIITLYAVAGVPALFKITKLA